MKKGFVFYIIYLAVMQGSSQNLVLNHSFEDKIDCNIRCCTLEKCLYWENGLSITTPDYLNACSAFEDETSTPQNSAGYQIAKTGNGYIGIYCSQTVASSNVREFVKGRMSLNLSAGVRYFVSFQVSLAEASKHAVASIGVHFSDTTYIPSVPYMLDATPQIENPLWNQLTDYDNWMQVSGSFVARGGEKYITIGNFKDDNNCGLLTNTGRGIFDAAYYYIDDVCVSANPADCGIDTTGMFLGVDGVDKEPLNIYPNPTQDKLYILSEAHLVSFYTITDIAGNVVQQGDIVAHQISIGDLAKGVYFVRLQGRDGSVYVKKMLKE